MNGEPRWALWNYETEAWDAVPSENAPGAWLGGHEYGYERREPTVEEVGRAIHEVFCKGRAPMHSSPTHSAERVVARLHGKAVR